MDIDRWHHPAAAADDVQVDERARSYRRNSLHDLPIRYQELAKPTNVDKKKVRTILPGEEPPGEEDERKYTFLNGPTLASFPFIFTATQCEEISKCPFNIWRPDSNIRPHKHELSLITTRPGLPPNVNILILWFYFPTCTLYN